ncbi:hypothetical protein F4553_002359 [Allocatelliglobosispora scoriae]|uniref:Uncharacterized protein n=1 Tax=Allocatelliglobosispora scoriae TaxID=643052 RepID=A0A841BQ80_9ACTN|nr:hypothetical protein [Allocatelliglobosispora scoriae]
MDPIFVAVVAAAGRLIAQSVGRLPRRRRGSGDRNDADLAVLLRCSSTLPTGTVVQRASPDGSCLTLIIGGGHGREAR